MNKIHYYLQITGLIIILIQLTSYIITAFSNPGLPKFSYEEEALKTGDKKFKLCRICNLWVNIKHNTFHCSDCDVCIEGIFNSL